ncbi:MAG: hypothetical protein WCR95_04060 [Eubacteriales bacterium]
MKDKLSIPKFVSFASGRMTRIAKNATETNFKLKSEKNGRLKDKLSIPKFVSFASGRMTRIAKNATETNFKLKSERKGQKNENCPTGE